MYTYKKSNYVGWHIFKAMGILFSLFINKIHAVAVHKKRYKLPANRPICFKEINLFLMIKVCEYSRILVNPRLTIMDFYFSKGLVGWLFRWFRAEL